MCGLSRFHLILCQRLRIFWQFNQWEFPSTMVWEKKKKGRRRLHCFHLMKDRQKIVMVMHKSLSFLVESCTNHCSHLFVIHCSKIAKTGKTEATPQIKVTQASNVVSSMKKLQNHVCFVMSLREWCDPYYYHFVLSSLKIGWEFRSWNPSRK